MSRLEFGLSRAKGVSVRLSGVALAIGGLLAAAAASAADGGYSAGVAVPVMSQTNFVYASGSIASLAGAHGSVPITGVRWHIGATATSQGSFQSRACAADGFCTPWVSGFRGASTVFNGLPASTIFHFEVRVASRGAVLLNPKILPSGKSRIYVDFVY